MGDPPSQSTHPYDKFRVNVNNIDGDVCLRDMNVNLNNSCVCKRDTGDSILVVSDDNFVELGGKALTIQIGDKDIFVRFCKYIHVRSH